jgi:hypothetical protein
LTIEENFLRLSFECSLLQASIHFLFNTVFDYFLGYSILYHLKELLLAL